MSVIFFLIDVSINRNKLMEWPDTFVAIFKIENDIQYFWKFYQSPSLTTSAAFRTLYLYDLDILNDTRAIDQW